MSEKVTKRAAEALHEEGLLNVSDFLYVLRNEAGQAADDLWAKIAEMNEALRKANDVHSRLSYLANTAERAAEREFDTNGESRDD